MSNNSAKLVMVMKSMLYLVSVIFEAQQNGEPSTAPPWITATPELG